MSKELKSFCNKVLAGHSWRFVHQSNHRRMTFRQVKVMSLKYSKMFLIEIYLFNIFKIKISLFKVPEAYITFWKLQINFNLEKYQSY